MSLQELQEKWRAGHADKPVPGREGPLAGACVTDGFDREPYLKSIDCV